jgi:hypothetical protein
MFDHYLGTSLFAIIAAVAIAAGASAVPASACSATQTAQLEVVTKPPVVVTGHCEQPSTVVARAD